MQNEAFEIVESVLASLFVPKPGRGRTLAFMFGDVGSPQNDKRIGTEIHIREDALVSAVLKIRRLGPGYLRKLPMSELRSMVTDFITDHYALMANEVLFRQFDDSYASVVSAQTKSLLAEALLRSSILHPKSLVVLYPLVPVTVKESFESDTFSLLNPESLRASHLATNGGLPFIQPTQFPPTSEWKYRIYSPSAWLIVRAPARKAADRMTACILGALALAAPHRYRYLCSQRQDMFGGWCIFSDGMTLSITKPLTPALMTNIELSGADRTWLPVLRDKLADERKATEREMKALAYFYQAWFLDEPSDRFPLLYMVLESLFGDAARATSAVIDGVRDLLGENISQRRLRALADLRAAMIHGGAPEIYDSKKYAKYYKDYKTDPVRDLELVVAECLRKGIFGSSLIEHADPRADEISRAVGKGLIPPMRHNSILDDPEDF